MLAKQQGLTREDYAKLRRSAVMKPVDDVPVWSIVCFVVPSDRLSACADFTKSGPSGNSSTVTVALRSAIRRVA